MPPKFRVAYAFYWRFDVYCTFEMSKLKSFSIFFFFCKNITKTPYTCLLCYWCVPSWIQELLLSTVIYLWIFGRSVIQITAETTDEILSVSIEYNMIYVDNSWTRITTWKRFNALLCLTFQLWNSFCIFIGAIALYYMLFKNNLNYVHEYNIR